MVVILFTRGFAVYIYSLQITMINFEVFFFLFFFFNDIIL